MKIDRGSCPSGLVSVCFNKFKTVLEPFKSLNHHGVRQFVGNNIFVVLF